MQKRRGEAWSILSHEWCSVSHLGIQKGGGVPDQKNTFRTCVLRFEKGEACFSLCECLKLQCFGQKLQDEPWSYFFDQGPLPLSVYLGRQNMIPMIKWTRFSPSISAYCKGPKTGRWEGLGTRLLSKYIMLVVQHTTYSQVCDYWRRTLTTLGFFTNT